MNKRRFIYLLIFLLGFIFFINDSQNVHAAQIISQMTKTDIFGDTLGVAKIYDDGKIEIEYKYGIKEITASYCMKKDDCDSLVNYSYLYILSSNKENPNKNENIDEMATYSYKIKLNKSGEYKIKIDVYYGAKNYDGGSLFISSRQTLDTGETYIKISSSNDIEDEEINKTLIEVTEIVNTIVIPIIYGLITIVLIIKGALIGTAIVKSADDPQVRQEKIGSLKWLVIGVVVAYSANTLVGVFTGFFKKLS